MFKLASTDKKGLAMLALSILQVDTVEARVVYLPTMSALVGGLWGRARLAEEFLCRLGEREKVQSTDCDEGIEPKIRKEAKPGEAGAAESWDIRKLSLHTDEQWCHDIWYLVYLLNKTNRVILPSSGPKHTETQSRRSAKPHNHGEQCPVLYINTQPSSSFVGSPQPQAVARPANKRIRVVVQQSQKKKS